MKHIFISTFFLFFVVILIFLVDNMKHKQQSITRYRDSVTKIKRLSIISLRKQTFVRREENQKRSMALFIMRLINLIAGFDVLLFKKIDLCIYQITCFFYSTIYFNMFLKKLNQLYFEKAQTLSFFQFQNGLQSLRISNNGLDKFVFSWNYIQ